MSYIRKEVVFDAVKKMKLFHDDVHELFDAHSMDLFDNLGRRNIILSQAQENFFAKELSNYYDDVISDGSPGQPDIVIGELNKELECKLTSPHKNKTIVFQTDYETLLQKKALDYLYIVVDKNFEHFGYLKLNLKFFWT